jgi:hypothetical protein
MLLLLHPTSDSKIYLEQELELERQGIRAQTERFLDLEATRDDRSAEELERGTESESDVDSIEGTFSSQSEGRRQSTKGIRPGPNHTPYRICRLPRKRLRVRVDDQFFKSL